MLRTRFLRDTKFPKELLDQDDNYMARGFYVFFGKGDINYVPSKIFDIFISLNYEKYYHKSFNDFTPMKI